MNKIQFHDLLVTPIAMMVIGIVIVVLMGLTMNAVVKREGAMMVREPRRDSGAKVGYLRRWGRIESQPDPDLRRLPGLPPG